MTGFRVTRRRTDTPRSSDWWTQPDAVAANANGQVTAEQWRVIAGPWVRPPLIALTLIAVSLGIGVLLGIVWGGVGVGLGLMGVGWLLVPAFFQGRRRWAARWRRHRRRRALARSSIASGTGRVTLSDGHAQARVGRTVVPLPRAAPPLPIPGCYRLYWLRSPARYPGPLLLAAQPVDAPADTQDPVAVPDLTAAEADHVSTTLLAAIRCGPHDVAANRAGRLTATQHKALQRKTRPVTPGQILAGLALTATFLYLGIGLVVTLAHGDTRALPDWITDLVYFAIFGGLWSFFLAFSIHERWERTRGQRCRAEVACAAGPVEAARFDGRWHLVVDNHRLPVSPAVAQEFFVPGRYAVYYLVDPPMLLSAEAAARQSRRPTADHLEDTTAP